MALLGFWGFDDTVAEAGASVGKAAAGRAGGVGSTQTTTFTLTFANATEVYLGAAYQCAITAAATVFCKLQEGTTVHLQISSDASSHVVIKNGAGTVLATSTATFDASTWPYIEIHALIADSGGFCEVKIDGTVVVSYTGDTKNGGTGVVNTVNWARISNGTTNVDDAYVCDATGSAPYNTYLGDIKVLTLLPTGDGDSSGWLGSDGNSTNNSLLVDEADSSMSDYVAASVSGTLDLYAMDDVPTGYDVLAIQELIYAVKSDAGTAPTVLPVAKGAVGTIRTDTALPALTTTNQSLPAQIRTTDPDGNALTAAGVNAMQVGVKIQ